MPWRSGRLAVRPGLPHRREEATGPQHTARALGWGTVGDCFHSFPSTHPPTHIAATSWWKTASVCPFLHVAVSASSGYGTWWQAQVCPWDRWPRRCSPLGTRGTGQVCHLPRLIPQSGARDSALVVPSCLLSSQATISPHRERVTLVLPPACCSCHGSLSCFPSVSRPQGQRLVFFSGGGVLHLPHTWLLSQAEGMLGQRVFRCIRVTSTELGRLAQGSSSSILKPNSDFPRNAVLSQASCPG